MTKSKARKAPRSRKVDLIGGLGLVFSAGQFITGVLAGIHGHAAALVVASVVLALVGIATGILILKREKYSGVSVIASRTVIGLVIGGLAFSVIAVVFTAKFELTDGTLQTLIGAWAVAAMTDSWLFLRVQDAPENQAIGKWRFLTLGAMTAIGMTVLAAAFDLAAQAVQHAQSGRWVEAGAVASTAVSIGAAAVVIARSRPSVAAMAVGATGFVLAGMGVAVALDRLENGILIVIVSVAVMVTALAIRRWTSMDLGVLLIADGAVLVVAGVLWSVLSPGSAVAFWIFAGITVGVAGALMFGGVSLKTWIRSDDAPGWTLRRTVVVITTSLGVSLGLGVWDGFLLTAGERGAAAAVTGAVLGWLSVAVLTFIAFLRQPTLTDEDCDKLTPEPIPLIPA